MRTPRRGKISDHAVGRSDLDRVKTLLSVIITVVGVIVGLIFTALSVRDVQFSNIPAFFGDTTFTKFALGLFGAHWAWGVKTDLEVQWRAYQKDPNKGHLLWRSIAGISLFCPFFIALFWFHKDIVVFQVILLVLIVANYYSWWAIISQGNQMAESSRERLAKDGDWFAVEQVELVYRYMNGRWQQIRFLTLIALCVLQVALAAALAYPWSWLAGFRGAVVALFGSELLPHVPGIAFFAYVLISSAWMSVMRLRLLFRCSLMQELLKSYVMRRRPVKPSTRTG